MVLGLCAYLDNLGGPAQADFDKGVRSKAVFVGPRPAKQIDFKCGRLTSALSPEAHWRWAEEGKSCSWETKELRARCRPGNSWKVDLSLKPKLGLTLCSGKCLRPSQLFLHATSSGRPNRRSPCSKIPKHPWEAKLLLVQTFPFLIEILFAFY